MKGHIYRRRRADGSWSRWYAVIDVPRGEDGKRRQVTSSHVTRREAQAWLAGIQLQVQADAADSAGGLRVGEYLESWVQGKSSLRPSTRLSYRGHVFGYLIPALGSVRLSELTTSRIEAVYAAWASQGGRGLSAATIQRVHATLRSALNSAVRRGLLERNPAEDVELPTVARTELSTWTAEQGRAFLEATRTDPWGVLFRLLLVTGMRRGEVLGLRWKDVDLDRGTVTISRQLVAVGSELVEGLPKSRSGRRTVVLDEVTRQDLVFRSLTASSGEGEALIFHKDGAALHPAFVSRHFHRLSKEAGLPRIRLHDLRHTSASLGLQAGESLVEVSRRLGHSSIAITADVYTDVPTAVAHDAAQRRGELLAGQPDRTAPVTPIRSRRPTS